MTATMSRRHQASSGPKENGWWLRCHPRQLWHFADGVATQLGVTNPEGGPATYFKAAPGETLFDCIRRQTPWFDETDQPFAKMTLGPGQFYPRIARPLALAGKPTMWAMETDPTHLIEAQNQLIAFMQHLEAICRVVEPDAASLTIYGHDIRNLLILAATEVEMHWRGILVANGRAPGRFTTNDYVRLTDPLRLAAYSVRFRRFPRLTAICPFADWGPDDPTASLPWYGAYHAVKHDRELAFTQAMLGHAIAAVAGCVALMVAQFGKNALTPDLLLFFGVEPPNWPLNETYLTGDPASQLTAVHHPRLRSSRSSRIDT